MSETLQRTPLYERHRDCGGRLVPFAGFEMPVQYASILAEHRAVRTQAGIFDVSHMGEIRLRGETALPLAQRLFTNHAIKTSQDPTVQSVNIINGKYLRMRNNLEKL